MEFTLSPYTKIKIKFVNYRKVSDYRQEKVELYRITQRI